jgi:hypothetical protein
MRNILDKRQILNNIRKVIIMNTEKVNKISKRLLDELRKKGYNINNEYGASNAIIIAIAEAYGEGFEDGERSGKHKTIDLIKNSIDTLRLTY